MDNKKLQIIAKVVKGVFSLMLGAGAVFYFAQYGEVEAEFIKLGFPTWIIYPLAVAKLAGIAVLWLNKANLREWAYAGFGFDLMLATAAHFTTEGDQDGPTMILPIALLVATYILEKKAEKAA